MSIAFGPVREHQQLALCLMAASPLLLPLFSGHAAPVREQDVIYCPHTSPKIHANGKGKNNAISMATFKAHHVRSPSRRTSSKSGILARAERERGTFSQLCECKTKEHTLIKHNAVLQYNLSLGAAVDSEFNFHSLYQIFQ